MMAEGRASSSSFLSFLLLFSFFVDAVEVWKTVRGVGVLHRIRELTEVV
jgi:hypothetical protein